MLELYLKKPKDIELRRVETLPPVRDDEVKIQLIYGGICGSDLGVYQGKLRYATYPIRPGHELLGRVIEAGKKADIETGTRVVVLPNSYCGQCEFCLSGKTNICSEKKSLGVTVDGGFSEQFVISAKYVLPVPDDVPDEKAVLIEPLAVVVHAFKKVRIAKGTKVLVVGCGNEGMLAVALALHLGADVTAVDINRTKIDLVKQLGSVRAEHPDSLERETFDVVVEAAGTKASFEQGIMRVKPGGSMVLIGIFNEANLPVVHVVRNELTLYGSIIYDFPADFQSALEYLRKKEFNVSPIVSKILPVTEYQQAYDLASSGNYGKVIISFKTEHPF